MERFFIAIYNYFEKHKAQMWIAAVCSFLFFGFFTWQIKFEQDLTSILPHEKKLDKQQQVFEDSRFSEKLTLCISQKDSSAIANPDELTAFADTFIITASTDLAKYIKSIDGKPSDSAMMNMMGAVQGDLPIYLSETDYGSIDSLFIAGKVAQQLDWDYNKLVSPEGMALKGVIQNDPAGISWLGVKKLQRLQVDERFELYDGYVMTRDHKHIMLFINPVNPPNATGKNVPFLKGLDLVLDSLQAHFPDVDAFYYGATATYTGNAVQVKTDTILTLSITIVLLVVFIGFYFKKKRAPVVIMIPVLFGGLFSVTVIYFIKGHISLVALGAASIVLGIAVNYSLHVYNHYRHLPDMRTVIKDLAMPMTIGSFTTIGGFLCLVLVPSPLLNDMGLFAAFSLVGATLCSLIFLPHWIEGSKNEVSAHEHEHVKPSWIDKIAEYKPETNKYMVGAVFALTILFLFTSKNVTIETDMMRMNFMTPKLKESERKFNAINTFIASSVYLVSEGNNLEEALENNERIQPKLLQLQEEGAIKKISGIGGLLLSKKEQTTRLSRWNNYWTAEKKQALMRSLQDEGSKYHFKPTAFDAFNGLLNKEYSVISPEELDILRSGALNNYIIEKRGKISVVTLLKVDPAQKNVVYKMLDGEPGVTVLDKQFATNSLVGEINNEFNNIAWLTSILVFVALLISYGRIELTLITFIPMLVSWVWILGLMGIFGIKFNIVNIILSTFIFGLGDDYSIFIMDGLLQRYKTGKEHLSSFKSSILLSAITTILGLGILIFAKHPAMQSIALISIVGIFCVVVTSQVMIPFMFNWLVTNRVKKGFAPWTLTGWAKSVFSLTYFAVGSFIMSAIGFVLLKLNPFNKEKGRLLFHKVMSRYTWSVLHIMGNVKKSYLNADRADFSKPAVIISNHQSFLDILVSTSMHPKVILLTNEWVWKSPIFGAVVRLAQYYPVAEGVEPSIERLKEQVERGYSIVVYPEGTRSPRGEIKRFHKGAFYIAEKLGLDVQPVLIHGTSDTMTKGDFLLKDGFITVKYLPRIKADDPEWGANYAERKKNISTYFRSAYDVLRSEREVAKYYRELLYYNYVYKGPVLEWYLRVKIRLEKDYEQFHRLLPMHGRITDIGCGYGFLSYMLHFLSKDRQITGIDYDEDKVETANHAYLKDESLTFVCADVATYNFDVQEAFVISDLLHYLLPEEQEELIKKCITNLSEGGVLLIRDGDADLKERQKGTALTEFFSTKALRFNKTERPLSFVSSARIQEIVEASGAALERIDNTRYTSNIIFVIKKLPALTYV